MTNDSQRLYNLYADPEVPNYEIGRVTGFLSGS